MKLGKMQKMVHLFLIIGGGGRREKGEETANGEKVNILGRIRQAPVSK